MIDISEIYEEYLKCYTDKTRIYMIEHFLKTYDLTRKQNVPYLLFPKQKELCTALGGDKSICTTKPRQAGVTTTTSAFLACEMVLADPKSPITILAIGNTLDLSQQFVTKIKDFIVQLPRWFFGEDFWSPDPNDKRNKEKIFLTANQKELKLANGSKIVARSSGPDASRGVGGVSYLVFDEAAFIENGRDVYASAIATVSTGGRVVLISTPNGRDLLYYESFRQAKLGLNGMAVVEMKWYQDPRYNKHLEWTKKDPDTGEIEIVKEQTLDKEGNIAYDEEHWEEMVKNGYKPRSPWYIGMCQKFNNNPQKIAQELDVSFLGSDSTVVAPEYVEMHREVNVREPNLEYKDATLEDMWIWKPPYEDHNYIIGVDNSKGDSDDFTAIQVIDVNGIGDDGFPCIEQVAEYNGKLTGDAVGEIVCNYGHMYNDAFVVVEDIGGYGSATLLTLMNLEYENLYYDDPSLKKYTAQNDATSMKVTENGLPGFHSSSVRFQMLSGLAAKIKDNSFKVRSSRFCNELDTWLFINGRIDHKDGCHDDLLTCAAMVLFVYDYSICRRQKEKTKDMSMLRSMITVNSRPLETLQERVRGKQVHGKAYMPAIVTPNSVGRKNGFSSSMWAFSR